MAPRQFKYVRPRLYPKQLAALFGAVRWAICEASTKAGKTHGCIVWLFEMALRCAAGQNVWWVAPTYAQAQIAWDRMRRSVPAFLFERTNKNDLTLTLINGVTIWFKTAEKPDNLYGEDVYACVIDEATRCREAAWQAVYSTLTATGAPCRIIGNVKGTRNWVAKLAVKAKADIEQARLEGRAPRYSYTKLTCWDAVEAGVLDREVVEEARAMLPEAIFKELYEGIPGEDGGNPFGQQHIAACVREGATVRADGVVIYPDDPEGKTPVAVWGWDVAKHQDYTVGVGLSATGRVVRFHRWHGKDLQANADLIVQHTAGKPALLDATHGSIGDGMMDVLQRAGHRNIEPFQFTGTTKQPLMEGLALRIQQKLVEFPEGILRDELDSFEFKVTRTHVTYSAPEGEHDDAVCALALAVKHLQTPRFQVMTGSAGAAF